MFSCIEQSLDDCLHRWPLGFRSSWTLVGIEYMRLAGLGTYVRLDIVEFRGSTMVDCPEKLRTGGYFTISLSFWLKPSAFQHTNVTMEEEQRSVFDEGKETAEEQMLRQRKSALIRLFKRLGLKPRTSGVSPSNSRDRLAIKEVLQKRSKDTNPSPKKIERVGDGEEVEVDDNGDDVSDNELNLIYKKCVCPCEDKL